MSAPKPQAESTTFLLALNFFLADVRAEVLRAHAKFPGNKLASIALIEEVGELSKALLDESPLRVREEAVQVACMAFRVGVEGDRSTDEHRRRRKLGEVHP